MLDAYAIKKMLPRLIIAVIAIQLSIYLCQFMIDFTNVAGQGIRGLFAVVPGVSTNGSSPADIARAIVDALNIDGIDAGSIAGIGGALSVLLGGIAAVALFPALALALALMILPMIFSVLITLVIRQVIIIALVIVSPIAMLLWVLPNTEKYAKQWFSVLLRILLMFPIINALYVVSAIVSVSVVTQVGSGSSGTFEEIILAVIALGCLVAPLVAIPFTFRFAGSLINGISSAVTNAGKKMAAPAQKWAWDTTKNQAAESRHGTRFNTDTRRGRFMNRMGQIGTGRFGVTDKGRAKRSAAHLQHSLHGAKELNEAGINNHHALNAITASHGDIDAAEAYVRAQHLDPHDQQVALDQLNLAHSVKMTREGRTSAAAIAVASQGRISADAVHGLNDIEDRSARASVFRTVQEAAKGQGQFEASLGTTMDNTGTIHNWTEPEGADKFRRDMTQLTTGDIQRAKTSTGDLMPQFLAPEIQDAQASGDAIRLGRLNDMATTWGNYHSAQTNIALETTLRGSGALDTDTVGLKRSGYAPSTADGVSTATRISKEQPGAAGPPPPGPLPPPPPGPAPAPPAPPVGPPPPAPPIPPVAPIR